jgi:hypothetical protein
MGATVDTRYRVSDHVLVTRQLVTPGRQTRNKQQWAPTLGVMPCEQDHPRHAMHARTHRLVGVDVVLADGATGRSGLAEKRYFVVQI